MTNRISISLDAGAQKALSALQESKPVRTPLALIIREAIFFYAKSIDVSIRPVPSPASPRRASSSSRPKAAKAEAPARSWPAGLALGIHKLCTEEAKENDVFMLADGIYTPKNAERVMMDTALDEMKRRGMDVEGYLALQRSMMVRGN